MYQRREERQYNREEAHKKEVWGEQKQIPPHNFVSMSSLWPILNTWHIVGHK